MIGLAINIVAFIIVAVFFIYLGLGALGLIATIFNSPSGDNKYKRLLGPVLRKLNISDQETISLNTSKEQLKKSVEIYYETLAKIFESETPDQRKDILSSNSPSGKFSNAFFAISGLSKGLNILTEDINYVMEGSGWVKYKELLKTATNGALKKSGNNKYEIIFNKNFYLKIEEYESYDYYNQDSDREKEWRVEGFYKQKEVLSCYTPRSNNVAYTFKPEVWILDILKSADTYARLLSEFKLKQATERRKSELFN